MLVRAARPIDLVKLRREERREHRVAQGEVTMFRSRTKLGMHRAGKTVLAPSVTGILPWWTYEARAIPGVGRAMVNVTNLNFLLEANDVDIPAGGLDLAFRRIYNSESGHDAVNTDGSGPSVFGNRWTNNFDVHLGWTPGGQNTGTVSVYTGDGARDDYSCTINLVKTCVSPTGVYDILATTQLGSNGIACQLQLTKKSGTSYIFDAPYSDCPSNQPGYFGRLLTITGRNANFYINLAYSWNPDATKPENIASIVATHEPDGAQLTMTFGQIAGSNPAITELQSIELPDGEVIDYKYNTTGGLNGVDKPGNNPVLQVNENIPGQWGDGTRIPTGNLPELYDMSQAGLLEACGPRATIGILDGSPSDGACVDFDYTSNPNQLTDWYTRGVLNPTPQDNVLTPSAIQSGPTGFVQWDDTQFFNDVVQGCGGLMAEMGDAYGHLAQWCYDGSNRVIQTSVAVSASSSLTTSQTWDANNNLTSTTDARGYTTKMGYDGNGNTVEVVLPKMTTYPGGLINPTSFYDYDAYNNVTYYCDPANNGGNNGWQPPADNLCETYGTNHAKFIFNTTYDAAEPYGCLIEMDTFGGYARTIDYSDSICGTGLPTDVKGAAIGQDNNRTPHQKFAYNTAGNLSTYSSYPTSSTQWVFQYTSDGMNRVTTRTNPDTYLSSNICYNLDGSVFYSETAWQYHLDGGPSCPTDRQLKSGATPPKYAVAYGYDPDGDVATEARHHNCTTGTGNCEAAEATPSWCTPSVSIGAGTSCKYYDGLDRLVEVKLPQADSDAYKYPWVTRYLYDLDGSQKSFHGAQFQAYGNLYATQELLGGTASITEGDSPHTVINNLYQNTKATAYDGIDRPIAKYSLVSQSLSTETLTWDTSPLGNGNVAGLLGTDCTTPNTTQVCQEFDYREDGKEQTFKSTDASYAMKRGYEYDQDGRTTQITSTDYNNPQQYTYNIDGRLSTSTDPSGETSGSDQMSPAVLTHNYYADGTLESLDVSSAAFKQTGLFSYSYRQDGLIQTKTVNDGKVPQIINAGVTNILYTYDYTGRMNNRSETGVAKNTTATAITYDGYGQESSYSSPATSLSDFLYSAEGELLGTTIVNILPAVTWGYNLRGELVYPPGRGSTVGPTYTANGVIMPTQVSSLTNYSWDPNMSVQTKEVPPCIGSSCNPINSSWAYDNAGRMIGQAAPFKYADPESFVATFVTRTYDAENHLRSTIMSGQNIITVEADVSWGPNGHPILIGTRQSGNLKNEVLHWDGNQLLFANSGGTGSLDDIKVDVQGDILPNDKTGYQDLTFYDRGPGGAVIGCHNATGSSFAGLSDSWNQIFFRSQVTIYYSPCSQGATGKEPDSIDWFGSPYTGTADSKLGEPMGQGGVLGMPRTDGLTDGFDTIQGVRSYDNTSGAWTSPDAYAGDVHNPMSQKSYVWNGNDPVGYSDPTGYDPLFEVDGGINAQPIGTDYYGGDPHALQAVSNAVIQKVKQDCSGGGCREPWESAYGAAGEMKQIQQSGDTNELGSTVYIMNQLFFHTSPYDGTPTAVDPADDPNVGGKDAVGFVHSHPGFTGGAASYEIQNHLYGKDNFFNDSQGRPVNRNFTLWTVQNGAVYQQGWSAGQPYTCVAGTSACP